MFQGLVSLYKSITFFTFLIALIFSIFKVKFKYHWNHFSSFLNVAQLHKLGKGKSKYSSNVYKDEVYWKAYMTFSYMSTAAV